MKAQFNRTPAQRPAKYSGRHHHRRPAFRHLPDLQLSAGRAGQGGIAGGASACRSFSRGMVRRTVDAVSAGHSAHAGGAVRRGPRDFAGGGPPGFGLFESLLERLPFVAKVYTSVRQLLDSMMAKKGASQRVVLVDFPDRRPEEHRLSDAHNDAMPPADGRWLQCWCRTPSIPHRHFCRFCPWSG